MASPRFVNLGVEAARGQCGHEILMCFRFLPALIGSGTCDGLQPSSLVFCYPQSDAVPRRIQSVLSHLRSYLLAADWALVSQLLVGGRTNRVRLKPAIR